MNNSDDILEIRFTGNDINPHAVKPHEIAELITGFEKAVLADIKDRHPEIDVNELLFVFDEVKNESIGIRFLPKLVSDVVVSSFTFISTSFETGDFGALSNETISELKTFTKFSKKYNCAGELKLNNIKLSSFTPTTEIQYNKNITVKGDINLFGRIMDAGGDNPNVHLKINDDQTIIFFTTEAHAKQLAKKLYEKVNLFGTAEWDTITYEIKKFKLIDVLDFTPGKTLNAIKEIRNLTGGHWDKYNSNDEINKQLLRD